MAHFVGFRAILDDFPFAIRITLLQNVTAALRLTVCTFSVISACDNKTQ